jgi:F-type H+-transporting ATPase subunit b
MELDWVTFALEVVNFLVLVWILQHFLYKPILAVIARRKEAVARELAEADGRRKEAKVLEDKYQARLTDWEKEKEQLRAKALAAVEDERKRRLAALQAELDRETERERAVVKRRADEASQRTEQAARERAGRLASAMLARLASPEVEARLAGVLVEDVESLDDARVKALASACDQADGRVRIESAYPLATEGRQRVVAALQKVVSREVRADFAEEASLVAGLRVTVGPLVLHANLADELAFFAQGVADAQ